MKNNTVRINKLISIFVLTFLIFSISGCSLKNAQKPVNNVDWVDNYKTIEEMIDNSDYILLAKVTKQMIEVRYDTVFTLSEVFVIKNYKTTSGIENLPIIVLQTGGKSGVIVTDPIEDVLMLENGKTYLLFMKKTDEGNSLVMGGFQGAASINNGYVIFPDNHAFNENKLNHLSVDYLDDAFASLLTK